MPNIAGVIGDITIDAYKAFQLFASTIKGPSWTRTVFIASAFTNLSPLISSGHTTDNISSDMPIRHRSLCDTDFYPLLHICTKGMTYEEKFAYRKKHGIPRTIDDWIAVAMAHTKAPTTYYPHQDGTSLAYLLWEDKVECILNVTRKEGLFEGVVKDPEIFTLTLRVRVPPTTIFLMHYWESPTVTIDKYIGEPCEKISPEWLKTVQTERRFWQNRTLVVEMLCYFVRNIPHNSMVATRVRSWCKAMSIPANGPSLPLRHRPKFFDPISPRNTRRHKPRASEMSAEESQSLRKSLNEGSPSRRRQ